MIMSEYQRVMRCQVILKYFGPIIQHIRGVDNMVANTLSRFPSTPIGNYEPSTLKSQCCANELFALSRDKNNEDGFPLTV